MTEQATGGREKSAESSSEEGKMSSKSSISSSSSIDDEEQDGLLERGDHSPVPPETHQHFLGRHLKNVVHFFVEDWFLSALLGIITALLSIGTDLAIESLIHWRSILFDKTDEINRFLGAFTWLSWITVAVTSAAVFCLKVAPQAVGSGIPELKVIMHGFDMKNYLTAKTLLAKIVGLTLTLGGGLPVGKEGPFVHMGSIVANLLTKGTESCRFNAFFSNEGRQMEMLASGCAVGIACTFSAPAGGVLYGIESTSKYFAVKNYWRSFFATTCAAIVFRITLSFFIPPALAGTITAYYQTNFPNEVFVIEEIPLFMLLGVLCGLAGAFFVFTNRHFSQARDSGIYKRIFGGRPILLTALSALLVGFITYPNGVGNFIAGKLTFRETIVDFVSNCTFSVTELNSTMACSPSVVNHWTGSDGDLHFEWTICLYIIVYFFLVAHCTSLSVPTGIFVPSFVMGAAGGRLLGEFVAYYFPDGFHGQGGPQVYPGLYAVVGAAAYTGAVTHSLSIAVIVCETTGQLCALLPVLIALMIANAISSFLQPSIYESIIVMKNYPYLTDLPPSRMSVHTLKISKIMVTDVVFISKKTTYGELRELLKETAQLKSYPVVTDKESKHLLGSVSRKALIYLLASKLGPDPSLMNKKNRTPSEFLQSTMQSIRRPTLPTIHGTDLFQDQTSLLNTASSPHREGSQRSRHESGQNELTQGLVDLTRRKLLDETISLDYATIDPAPFQLVKSTTLYKVHQLFSLLTLNHAYVTDRGRLVGVVSLKELRETLANVYLWGAQPPARKVARAVISDAELQKLRAAHDS